MKRIVMMAFLAVSCAGAEWRDVQEGLDPQTVAKSVGLPLIETNGRHGMFMTWIYDDGGYVMFERGRVHYWQAPQPKKRPAPEAVRTESPPVSTPVAKKDRPAVKKEAAPPAAPLQS
jgi:hypothetical protein